MPLLTSFEETPTEEQQPMLSSGYQCLNFPDSIKFLLYFNDDYRKGTGGFAFYPWQVEVNQDICYGRTRLVSGDHNEIIGQKAPTSISPYKFCLCAANGSGKDAFVIAPLVLWFICCKIRSKVIITSSSGNQLTTQTEKYITELAQMVNAKCQAEFGQDIIKIRKRHYTCLLTGSVIHMFATDEPEKAEGHHPTAPGCEMMIVINEAKSIPPEIYNALRRCTGYNYWIDVSSPGEPMGPFHDHYQTWLNKRRVTVFDCLKHHAMDEFEEDRRLYGEHSHFFRSKWLALFTYIGGAYVVPQDKLEKLRNRIRNGLIKPIRQSDPIRVGIDIALSGNGDETVVSIWRGNKQLAEVYFRVQDSTILADNIETVLVEYKVPINHPHIFADDGGVGRSVIDIINRKGWRINRVLNQSAARNKKQYKNRGAQLWYKFSRLISEGVLIFKDPNNNKLFSQIASRKFKETAAGLDKLTLQSKKEMIAEGLPSPDRADAAVLAFTDVNLEDYLEAIESDETEENKSSAVKGLLIEEIKAQLRSGAKNYIKSGRRNYSQNSLIRRIC